MTLARATETNRQTSDQAAVVSACERGAMAAAARVIKGGGVVAFPTETVYGLAVRPNDDAARVRLRRIKGRPAGKPFQILLSSRRRVGEYCSELPDVARRLARTFWPGPLTLVVKDRRGRWVGLRVPDHPVALDLARRAGGALVATSANVSGCQAARNARELSGELVHRVDLVLVAAAGRGKASTVVRVSHSDWKLLREGAISRRQVADIVGGD